MERIASWGNIGTPVTHCNNMEEVLKHSKLDYQVDLKPLTADGLIIPNRKATIATYADGSVDVKGIVSDSYTVCQNNDAFSFINEISMDSGLEFVTAGETYNGLVYIVSKLPSFNVFGDEITPHIIFQNSHNGQYPLKATICALRIVCANQFASTFSQMDNTVRIYHTTSLEDKLLASREVMKRALEYSQHFQQDAEQLYDRRLSTDQINSIFDTYLRQSRESAVLSQRQEDSLQEQLEKLQSIYNCDDNQNFKNTMWGAVNAFTDFATHKQIRNTSKAAENLFLSTAIDTHAMNKFYQIADSIAA